MLHPDPPSALGNPAPPVAARLALPDMPPLRQGRRVGLGRGTTGVDLAACRNILVVKLDFIGDWVLTTPFLAGLRRAAPDAHITAVVLDRVFALAGACKLVDRVVAVPAAATGPVIVGAATEADLGGFLAEFGSGAFDLALVPRWDTDFNGATRIAAASGATSVVGFSEACAERKRAENAGFDRFLDVALLDTRAAVHEVERLLSLLEALGGGRDDARLHLDIADADRAAASGFRMAAFGPSDRPLLAVAPFAAGRRQWPFERTAALAAAVAAARGMDVAVIGGPENVAPARELAARIAASGARAASAAGVLGLRENAALAGLAALFIGMDSGPGHMAAALGVPVVTISAHPEGAAPGHPGAPERFAPWVSAERLLVLRPPGHRPPCSDGCDADEPHCILEITVADAVPRVLAFAARLPAYAPGVQR